MSYIFFCDHCNREVELAKDGGIFKCGLCGKEFKGLK